jgi:hypothetical protein
MNIQIFADSSDRPLEAIASVVEMYKNWRSKRPAAAIRTLDTTATAAEGSYVYTLLVGYEEAAHE